ncbi:DUF3817 domain-containing protein [Actinoplanes sp. L3-i22]|uniref:DUF3817 domain-containing protein n=1 Tax=Actinoplanes sp. L3-i22 TaxID=2836373 RepID=UPI001C77D90F|nr:DUF3817 domain-containing protein [Actinoplanes sp. L3-i22]BCY10606.1 hypothetical protein L3i22_056940 [Actinoplanes sp. L3-i22]
MSVHRPLRIAAAVELISLLILVTNLATVHARPVASLCGPVHGCAYLAVLTLTAWTPGAGRTTKLIAWIPGIGGLLAIRRLTGQQFAGQKGD